MSHRHWKLSAVLTVMSLTLCAPIMGPEGGPTGLTWNINPATCTGDGNGGAVTVVGTELVCSADDGGAGGTGDPVLIDGVGVADAAGVNFIGGTGVDYAFNAGVSPDTATASIDLTEATCNAPVSCGATSISVSNIAASDLASTVSFANGQLLDFGTNVSSATEGLFIPANATTCASATAEGQVCWEEDANHLWVGDGAAAVDIGPSAGGSDPWTRVATTSDLSNTSATVYQAVSDLNMAISASTDYRIRCILWVSTVANTIGFQLQTQGPSAPTALSQERFYCNSTTSMLAVLNTAFDSSSTDDGVINGSTTPCANKVDILLRNAGNAGTIQFAFVSETAANNVTLLEGSWCEFMTF